MPALLRRKRKWWSFNQLISTFYCFIMLIMDAGILLSLTSTLQLILGTHWLLVCFSHSPISPPCSSSLWYVVPSVHPRCDHIFSIHNLGVTWWWRTQQSDLVVISPAFFDVGPSEFSEKFPPPTSPVIRSNQGDQQLQAPSRATRPNSWSARPTGDSGGPRLGVNEMRVITCYNNAWWF